ncbi:hypothetical protein MMC30_001822 [Trapelia coarctata]|nr:hypothetical protein [Trapelia coarctata]
MSGSNPFRRKQQAQLDHDDLRAAEDEVGRATARFPALDTENPLVAPKTTPKKVRIISPHSSAHSSKFDSGNDEGYSRELTSSPVSGDIIDESLVPGYREGGSSGDESPIDPFQAEVRSGSEDSMDGGEEAPLPAIPTARSVPPKARSTLNVDSDNPWRTSTLIGNLPGSSEAAEHRLPDNTHGVPEKAQKTLGISRSGNVGEGNARYQLPPNAQKVPPKAQRTLGIPSNPFQKNVASKERRYFDENDDEGAGISRNPATMSNRPPLDVDAFTRLLLTGEKQSSAASTPSVNMLPFQGMLGDTSSNTDASSLSRHSFLESQTDSHLETPRTSHESTPSVDEIQKSMGKSSSLYDIGAPRTPRANNERLGRPAPSLASDFSSSAPPAELPMQRPRSPTRHSPILSPKSSTDLNKPLPPPPIPASPDSTVVSSATLSSPSDFSSGPYELPASRPRVAPAPPLARRHSQLRPKYTGTSPGRSTPIAEEQPVDTKPSTASSSPIPGKPPAPPPPRKRGTDRNSVILEAPRLPELAPISPMFSLKAEKQPPPLPPSRTASVSKRHVREGSMSSTAPSMAPPPPPPPRRRGSSGSSYSLRRPSSEVGRLEEEVPKAATPKARAQSTSQSSADVISKAAAGNRDIMADLSKLQREVDELRGRYERKGSGDQPDQSWNG